MQASISLPASWLFKTSNIFILAFNFFVIFVFCGRNYGFNFLLKSLDDTQFIDLDKFIAYFEKILFGTVLEYLAILFFHEAILESY